jgi:hypothetical protein
MRKDGRGQFLRQGLQPDDLVSPCPCEFGKLGYGHLIGNVTSVDEQRGHPRLPEQPAARDHAAEVPAPGQVLLDGCVPLQAKCRSAPSADCQHQGRMQVGGPRSWRQRAFGAEHRELCIIQVGDGHAVAVRVHQVRTHLVRADQVRGGRRQGAHSGSTVAWPPSTTSVWPLT